MDQVSEFGEARMAPLSHEQEQLWVQCQLAPQVPADNECVAVTVDGPVDADMLREGLDAVIERHEAWRTVFASRDGVPTQVVLADVRCGWSVADLDGAAEAEQEAAARRLAEHLVGQPFDLAGGPLVRALLVRLSAERHRLFITWHRIVADRVSVMWVMLPELAELYEARTRGQAGELSLVGEQYADYAMRQRQQPPEVLQSGSGSWSEHLSGAPTVLELPADRRRAGQPGWRGQGQSFSLGAGLTARLRELSHREQVSLRVTLTAAFEALLYRYTGQEDLLLGWKVPGRRPQQAAGLFTSTLVLRADLSGEPSVRELLSRTRTETQAAREQEYMQLWEAAERGADGHPAVQVLLEFEPEPPALPDGWRLEPADIRPPVSRFDLCVEVDERSDVLAGRFVYRSDLFEAETISRMTGHWRMLLEGMTGQPWLPVQQLPMLTGPETEQLLQWSTGPELEPYADIVAMISEQAALRPDDVAVSCDAERLSYRQLDAEAGRLAGYLRAQGVDAEVPVGVCLERSVQQVVALLAILRAGGGYVPLDPEAPAERNRLLMDDTAMPVVVTQERLREAVAASGAEVVSLDGDRAAIDQHSAAGPDGEPKPDQLGYIIYTSGSTGRPKGVMVERGALSAHSRAMAGVYQLRPRDRVLQFSQYSADASLEQILSALVAGAHLVVRGTEIWSSRRLLEALKREQVTVMNLSPAYWQQTVRDWASDPAELAGLRLRLVILGGERLSARAVQDWRDLGVPGVRLVNAYGPTEATITATLAEAGTEPGGITIGRPLPGRAVYILDDGGRPVPAGVLGELHIGGPLLARGYFGQPALTKERFVHDPFSARPGGRLYRTGDLVRWLPDGRIDYVGRNDEQVKIRGFRIELGEVEAVLSQHPAVGQAVVVAQGEGAARELAAFVVASTAAPLSIQELRAYLNAQLPRHMQPAAIQQLAELPRLATGKPDRRRLPQIARSTRPDEVPYVPAQLLAEQQLIMIWEELLEPRPIGIKDNFFHLGGNSLQAAQLLDRIERTSGKKVALSALFANPTVEQLARTLQSTAQETGERVRLQTVQAEGTKIPFFFLHGDWTGGAFYCFALARACGPDQPFYVLEPYRFSAEEPVPTLETIAAAHIEAMRKVQPEGPYRLGGFCNGGLLAYEMARQLERNGEQVDFLGLIDPSPPVQSSLLRIVCDGVQKAMRAGSTRQADLYLRVRHIQRHIYRRLLPGGGRVQDFGRLVAIDRRLDAMFARRDALYADYIGVLTWAAARYRTGIYRGRITFFWAREEKGIAETWRPVTKHIQAADLDERTIAGSHMATITDHIQDLAVKLSACLAQAGQDADRAPRRREPDDDQVTCKIRPLCGSDVWQVLAIERQAFPDDPWTALTVNGWLARATRAGQARHATRIARFIRFIRLNETVNLVKLIRVLMLDRPRGLRYVVAEAEDGEIAGYACLSAHGTEATIPMIAVRPDRQRRRIGTDLLMELIAMAAAAECRDISLFVRADNSRARRLYRRTGFTEAGIQPGFYQPSGTDAVVVRLSIPTSGENPK